MEEFSRILIVSRMSTYCRQALHFGISLARKYGAELSIIHVMYNAFAHMNLPMLSLESEYQKDMEKVKKQLDDMISREKDKGMTIREFIREGHPLDEILKVVKAENIDLVVLHAHRDSHWDHFQYGYSNDELIRKIPCSILLLRKD